MFRKTKSLFELPRPSFLLPFHSSHSQLSQPRLNQTRATIMSSCHIADMMTSFVLTCLNLYFKFANILLQKSNDSVIFKIGKILLLLGDCSLIVNFILFL